jgi:hypothetical protein
MLAMAANVSAAVADMADAPEVEAAAAAPIATVEVATRKTRSSVELSKNECRKSCRA